MRNAKRADILLEEAKLASDAGEHSTAYWLTARARDYLAPSRTKSAKEGRVPHA